MRYNCPDDGRKKTRTVLRYLLLCLCLSLPSLKKNREAEVGEIKTV
jgi:hypothetical protein